MLAIKNMDYPKEVVDYAIDNKVSLDEAYKIYVLNGGYEEVNMDEHLTPNEKKIAEEFSLKDELRFVEELEEKIKQYKNYNDNEVSKEDLEWVEDQLKQLEEMQDE